MNLDAKFFFDLERRLKDAGLDSDSETFDVIKERLSRKEPLSADEFARQAIYVILAGGFSQKTAKKIHAKVMDYLSKLETRNSKLELVQNDLLNIFNNKNKIGAIIKIWHNKRQYRDEYYRQPNLESRISNLEKLPHIGKITANHLARNLGEDVVKYDIWIQRLGVAFAVQKQGKGNPPSPRLRGKSREEGIYNDLKSKIDNGNLDPDVKAACDEMFAHLVRVTGLPRGYIDVVLWKGAQNHMIKGI